MSQKDQNRNNDQAPLNPEREPAPEPNSHPTTGQQQPDIQDGRASKKHSPGPEKPGNKDPEGEPGDDPREFTDGEPVEEKSPRVPRAL